MKKVGNQSEISGAHKRVSERKSRFVPDVKSGHHCTKKQHPKLKEITWSLGCLFVVGKRIYNDFKATF
jgi:hypothetical protein